MKAFDHSGRAAVVTGGNGGIGLGMARGLAKGRCQGRYRRAECRKERRRGPRTSSARRTGVGDRSRRDSGAGLPPVGRGDRRPFRAARHSGQQRRHRASKTSGGLHGARLASGDRQQPDQRVSLFACRLSAHDESRRRQDHQHRIDPGNHERAVRCGLFREQGRHRAR
jgi:hypothetical protein